MSLVSNVEFKAARDIGNKVDESKLTEAIILTEKTELYDLLGEFLFDCITNKDSVAALWVDLFAGSTFTVNGETFIHDGLKAVVIDLAYSRYLSVLNPVFTPFGIAFKDSDDLERVDKETLNRLVTNAKKDADAKMRVVKKYLEENSSSFLRYNKKDTPDFGLNQRRWRTL